MKFLNKKQKNNKGFSLVELIVVIAIMVVLVAVLAPVFTKYIESSRRATDVQNANSIAEGVLAAVADGKSYSGTTEATPTNVPVLKDTPKVKGDAENKGESFYFTYNADKNTVSVTAGENGTKNLADEKQAQEYKDM